MVKQDVFWFQVSEKERDKNNSEHKKGGLDVSQTNPTTFNPDVLIS